MQIKNVSPYGALDVPLLGREGEPYDEHGTGCLSAGEVVEVSEAHARILLEQIGNYEPADAAAQAIADELAAEREAIARLVSGAPPAESALKPVSRGDTAAAGKTKPQLIAEHGAQHGDDEGDA